MQHLVLFACIFGSLSFSSVKFISTNPNKRTEMAVHYFTLPFKRECGCEYVCVWLRPNFVHHDEKNNNLFQTKTPLFSLTFVSVFFE